MQQYKKRARILSEKIGGKLTYGNDGSLAVNHGDNSATFAPISKKHMNCTIKVDGQSASHQLPKPYVFDVIDKLGSSHLASSLLQYQLKPILQLDDYINDEDGQQFLDQLRLQIAENPLLTNANLGGNRIIVEFYQGILIIWDDLLWSATNVIEFIASEQ